MIIAGSYQRSIKDGKFLRRDYRDILRLIQLEAEIEKKDLLLRTHESEFKARLESEVVGLKIRLIEKQAELDKITNTLGWRLLSHYGRFKYRFLLPAWSMNLFVWSLVLCESPVL